MQSSFSLCELIDLALGISLGHIILTSDSLQRLGLILRQLFDVMYEIFDLSVVGEVIIPTNIVLGCCVLNSVLSACQLSVVFLLLLLVFALLGKLDIEF